MASADDLTGAPSPPLSSSSPSSGMSLHNEESSASMVGTAGREELRGLGGQFMCLTFHAPGYGLHQNYYTHPPCIAGLLYRGIHARPWATMIAGLIAAANPDLNEALYPYEDPALLERHGETLLDIIIRMASDKEWEGWLKYSLKAAAYAGAMGVLLRLFDSSGDAMDGRTLSWLLNAAAKGGSLELMSALFAAGAGSLVRVVDETSRLNAALHIAANNGHRSCVAKLIEAGAPVDLRLGRGGTALTEAVEGGHSGVVLELLAAGADVNKIVDIRPSYGAPHADLSPLGIAVEKHDEEMVKVLLEAGAEPCKGPADFLPLHVAASLGTCDIINSLLLAGAKVESVDNDGRSALHLACAYNQCDAVDLLLRNNACVTSLCNNGHSPMDVVGMQVLAVRQRGAVPDRTTRWARLIPEHVPGPGLRARGIPSCRLQSAHPSTLNSAETSNVDKICDMLQSAGAWGRRGWLVIMRSRRLAEGIAGQPESSDADALTPSVLALRSVREPSRNSVGPIEEGGFARALHDGGQARTDWSAAVVRLLRVPEESLFCNIVGFL